MRTGILANSLPAALDVFAQVKSVHGCEPLILLCPVGKQSFSSALARHAARLAVKSKRWRSLSLILTNRVRLLSKPLDHPQSIEKLRKLKLNLGLHRTGEIYRAATIQSFALGILNSHIGLLPQYRGRNVMEWTLLEGETVGITVFFVDEGIDTGTRMVVREAVDISHCRTLEEAKEYLFGLDAIFFKRALERLADEAPAQEINNGTGRRFYVMSGLFRSVVQDLITANK